MWMPGLRWATKSIRFRCTKIAGTKTKAMCTGRRSLLWLANPSIDGEMSNDEGNVVDLDSQRPHTSGPMICHGCGHEWIGVLRSGMVSIECPACRQNKGMRAGWVLPQDASAFHCTQCADEYKNGNALFIIYFTDDGTTMGMMCAHCGYLHDIPTLADV